MKYHLDPFTPERWEVFEEQARQSPMRKRLNPHEGRKIP